MPRRPREVADIGFSLPGLTSDLQDETKQQQKTVLDEGPVCCSSAAVCRVWFHAVHHRWCFVFSHGHGKVSVETGSENPALVGSELAGTPALGASPT